jgi:flagellar basal body-associated protein FliL
MNRSIIIIIIIIIIVYLLTAIGLTPGGSSAVHNYTQTVHIIQRMEHTSQ